MAEVNIQFPDGTVKQFEKGVTVEEIAKSISISLAKKAVAGKFDGKLVGYHDALEQDGSIEIITKDSEDGLVILWNTVAQILKHALHNMYPKMKFGESSATEHGFCLDTDNADGQISEDGFDKITAEMNKLIKQNIAIEKIMVPVDEALSMAEGDEYQTALINENAVDGQVEMYQQGDFKYLGGVQLPATGAVKVFQILSVAGAYWKGASSNPMLQRVYGTAFYKQKDLDVELERRKEAQERDHRVIGNKLDLFFVDPKVGAGLPYWMPKGATIRRTIERYIIDKEVADGYQHVYTPVLMNLNAYKQSGHWDHYHDDMFPPMDMGDGEFLELRPMNCPSHIQIYKHHKRSYRELPLRIAEIGMMHRYEKSGALSGLQRVREMELNDGHTFVALDQIQDEFAKILRLIMDVYKDFNITDYTFRLSYRDPKNTEKYFANDEMWERSQKMLKGAMDDLGLDYVEAEGEAAFYGPKLDIQTKTALGNDETMSTIQLDFMLPERFGLTYVGQDGEEHRPVMIHRGIVGTMERFIAYLTEIYKGAFPTWLAPVQVEIIPVNLDAHGEYAEKVRQELAKRGFRAEVDTRNEKMGYKIRESQTQKVPYTLVLGDDEMNANGVNVRPYGTDQENSMSLDDFIKEIDADVKSYSRDEK